MFSLSTLLLSAGAHADNVSVAVASNFAPAAERLVTEFEMQTGHDVRLLRGSSGKLYAQIVNGAPFDVFLSADRARPEQLERRGFTEPGSAFLYASGTLVIWSRDSRFAGKDCWTAIDEYPETRIAIANPLLAPYGAAAKQVLQQEGRWDRLESRLVTGENVAQTLQFAVSGGAGAAFIAGSQLESAVLPAATCTTRIDAASHEPIAQHAVLLAHGRDNPGAIAFVRFLQSAAARRMIEQYGYLVPPIEAHVK